jgi:dinuclear metal center YbgI/SA1388 family protein
MQLKEITNILENWCPLNSAEEFDNVGLLVGNSNEIINKAIITIDTTEEVVDEAIKNDCNLIITFHPIIFDGLKNITEQTYVERIVFKAIQNNINIYAIHTNLDNNPRGVNYKICQKLELNNTKFLISKNEGAFGMGMIGELNKELSEIDFFNFLNLK